MIHEVFEILTSRPNCPKAKTSSRELSLFAGEGDDTEKPIDPTKVYSEELIREVEKIASTLVLEKDCSFQIAAMQRTEGLVLGGAAANPCFHGFLKQLVGLLSIQLSDRRSSIVKQACHLLRFLSKELLGDFEACVEMFIPVLFKLVVIEKLLHITKDTIPKVSSEAEHCLTIVLSQYDPFRYLSVILVTPMRICHTAWVILLVMSS